VRYHLAVTAGFIVLSKVPFSGADPTGSTFQLGFAATASAGLTAVYLSAILLPGLAGRTGFRLPRTAIFILPLAYYVLGLLTVPFSLAPSLSLYRAASGVGFVLAAWAIGRDLRASGIPSGRLVRLWLWTVFVSGIVSNMIFWWLVNPRSGMRGLPSGYVVVIGLYLALLYLWDLRVRVHAPSVTRAVALLVGSLWLTNASAYVAFGAGLVWRYLRRGTLWVAALQLGAIFTGTAWLLAEVTQNPDAVYFNKPAGAFLTGSGRFAMYERALQVFADFSLPQKLLGVGFMAERSVLAGGGLAWSTDPHNSFLLSLLGLGAAGASIYLMFVLAPFLQRHRRSRASGGDAERWLAFHVMCVVYGTSSSQYLGTPSVLLLVSLSVASVVVWDRRSLRPDAVGRPVRPRNMFLRDTTGRAPAGG
jgi:hypothetical protein